MYSRWIDQETDGNSKMAFLMLFRQRMAAISIMGREVMQPRGLIGLGKDTLDACGSEIAKVNNPLLLSFIN
jgi:hypothetical protein